MSEILKESMRTISYQILNKEKEKNQVKILDLKSTIAKMKNSM